MEISTIFWTILKLMLVVIAYKVYQLIYVPWSKRRRALKYPNVYVAPKFVPLLGEIGVVLQNEKENKFRLYHVIENAMVHKDMDINFTQSGDITAYKLCSIKSLSEMTKLVPEKVDRNNHKDMFLDVVTPNSIMIIPSNQNWDVRRKTVMKTIGINFASQYIQLTIETVDEWIKNVNLDKDLDLSFEVSLIDFNIISKIMFGTDIDKMEKCRYINPYDHSVQELSFKDVYINQIK